MEFTSVSKGTFASAKKKICQRNKASPKKLKIDKAYCLKDEPWYKAFKTNWEAIENAVAEVSANTFRQILTQMTNFVDRIARLPLLEGQIPTGILLAGVNLPDHDLLLQELVLKFQSLTPHIAITWSRDATTLKSLTEGIVYSIINGFQAEDDINESTELSELKKSHCTFYSFQAWHEENCDKNTPIVLILPDFEGFPSKVLHDFILILSSYSKTMKFVLIFGVATSLHIVHRTLSYDATSKLTFEVFHTQTQVERLSDLLNGIILTPNIPFKLTGQAFKFLVDIFLFYDFSVNGFLQSYKLCMWVHFHNKNELSLCCPSTDIKNRVDCLSKKDLVTLKHLDSVEKYMHTSGKNEFKDNEFKEILKRLLKDFDVYMNHFLIILKCLNQLTAKLPGSPLGKWFRDIYKQACGKINICETEEYGKAIKYIGCFSKDELLLNLKSVITILSDYETSPRIVIDELQRYMNKIKDASLDVTITGQPISIPATLKRYQFTEALKKSTEITRSSPYKQAVSDCMEYLDKKVFSKYLKSPRQIPLNEIFCFDDLSILRSNRRGSLRAAIHTPLNNVKYVLNCKCCASDEYILPTHPDLSIAYKLHLEYGTMINLYDWLQTFASKVGPERSDDEKDIDPVIRARFTNAVSELQFLGFIKATKKKTDHVKRLTHERQRIE